MLDRSQEPSKDVRNYVRDRYASAIQLLKNIEQRKQTILKVCQSIVRRQTDFLERGIDELRPMMIKEIAEEIGVHPSTTMGPARVAAGRATWCCAHDLVRVQRNVQVDVCGTSRRHVAGHQSYRRQEECRTRVDGGIGYAHVQ